MGRSFLTKIERSEAKMTPGLRTRIEGIILNQIGFRLASAEKVFFCALALVAAIMPIAVGIHGTVSVHAQSAGPTAQVGNKFEVASIRAVEPGEQFMFGIRPMPGGRIIGTNVTLKLL